MGPAQSRAQPSAHVSTARQAVALEPCEVLSVPGARVRAAVPATPAVER